MSKKSGKNREEIINDWLNLYPKQALECERNENENVVVLVPHNENWFTRKFLPKAKGPAAKIKLDDIGTFVWDRCNGTTPVKQICEELEEKFGDSVKPAEERTVMFVQQMYKENFISVFKKEDN